MAPNMKEIREEPSNRYTYFPFHIVTLLRISSHVSVYKTLGSGVML